MRPVPLLLLLGLAAAVPARGAPAPNLRLAYGSQILGELDPCG